MVLQCPILALWGGSDEEQDGLRRQDGWACLTRQPLVTARFQGGRHWQSKEEVLQLIRTTAILMAGGTAAMPQHHTTDDDDQDNGQQEQEEWGSQQLQQGPDWSQEEQDCWGAA